MPHKSFTSNKLYNFLTVINFPLHIYLIISAVTKMRTTPEATTDNALYEQIGGVATFDTAPDVFFAKYFQITVLTVFMELK
jgi:hypothetical protein